MTRPQPSAMRPASRATLIAFVVGLPLAAGLLYVAHFGPYQHPVLKRYLSHPVELASVGLFCMALLALGTKLLGSFAQRRALRRQVLPRWDGQPVPVSQAAALAEGLGRLPRGLRNTYLVRRVAAVLDFLRSRGSAAELDDQLRALGDTDAMSLEGSYSLTRFISWAIPILGFLGTVLGITDAVAGVTPEILEQSLSTVTDGLSLAFDTTALALALTMVIMFLSFLVERLEQGILEAVDRYVDDELAHRFLRAGTAGGEFVEVVRQNTNVLVEAVEQLVQKQAALWASTLRETERRRSEEEERMHQRLTTALENALQRTLEAHARRLAAVEKQTVEQSAALLEKLASVAATIRATGKEQQAALLQVAQGITAQAGVLAGLQEGDMQLLRLQETVGQNLAALAGAGTLEQAVHSLTAAIHLMTAQAPRAGATAVPAVPRSPAARSGAAA